MGNLRSQPAAPPLSPQGLPVFQGRGLTFRLDSVPEQGRDIRTTEPLTSRTPVGEVTLISVM